MNPLILLLLMFLVLVFPVWLFGWWQREHDHVEGIFSIAGVRAEPFQQRYRAELIGEDAEIHDSESDLLP